MTEMIVHTRWAMELDEERTRRQREPVLLHRPILIVLKVAVQSFAHRVIGRPAVAHRSPQRPQQLVG